MTGETVGEYLKKERELRHISLQEVAEETKISVSRLKALEANQFDQLPAPIYIRGFVRIYAEYIGLDPADVMMRFEDQLFVEEPDQRGASFKTLEEERLQARRRMIKLATMVAGAIILIALGLFFYFDQQDQQNRAMEGLTLETPLQDGTLERPLTIPEGGLGETPVVVPGLEESSTEAPEEAPSDASPSQEKTPQEKNPGERAER